MNKAILAGLILVLASCGPENKRVRISLPLPPKLDMTDYDFLYFPGFITTVDNDEFDAEREAINFLRREILRKRVMKMVPRPPLDLSERNPREFFLQDQPFFKNIKVDKANRILALTGEVAFEKVDRSGFKEVERVDFSGRSYRQTQFVEMTGFNLDMRIYVYNLDGKMLYSQLLRDSTELEGVDVDQHLVFFDLMQRISDRIMGLFSNTLVRAERSLM